MREGCWSEMAQALLSRLYVCCVLLAVGGCAMMNPGERLSRAILEQSDPETVRDGAPAYLLLVDSLILDAPNDVGSLRSGAQLYSLYASVFVDDPERAKRLAERAREYGQRAACARKKSLCGAGTLPYEEFVQALERCGRTDLPALYAFTVSWMAWVKANSGDWNALADLPKIEAALKRIIDVDGEFEDGAPNLYLGILYTLRPPAFGGRPDLGKWNFERALELSGGRNLGAKVEYARSYARLVYDRELHDRLLREVLEDEAAAPGLTLWNTLAKRQAKQLLDSADDYF